MGPSARWESRLGGDAEGAPDSAHVAEPSVTQNSDELAQFSALLRDRAATITRIAAALVGMADAEDAAQEAVLRAWRAWPALRERNAAHAWLSSITVNVCRDWLRGRFGARLRFTEPLAEHGERQALATLGVDPGGSDYTNALDLRAAINALDEDLRLVVVLRYYASLDSSAIGAALGIPAATARTRLRRALSLLREQLSGANRPSPSQTFDTPIDTPEGRR
jgi:RNA polymerase sigma-70 factor (ECF subfamily)